MICIDHFIFNRVSVFEIQSYCQFLVSRDWTKQMMDFSLHLPIGFLSSNRKSLKDPLDAISITIAGDSLMNLIHWITFGCCFFLREKECQKRESVFDFLFACFHSPSLFWMKEVQLVIELKGKEEEEWMWFLYLNKLSSSKMLLIAVSSALWRSLTATCWGDFPSFIIIEAL